MFDAYDNNGQEFDSNQFVVPTAGNNAEADMQHCVTLIGTSDYSLEVQMCGFVSVERELLEAEAFLASLYEHC
jgi:hypothetical protein